MLTFVAFIKNFDKLLILLERFQKMPEIICLSETNILKSKKNETEKTEAENTFIPSLEGYFFVRNDGTYNMGGTGIFV